MISATLPVPPSELSSVRRQDWRLLAFPLVLLLLCLGLYLWRLGVTPLEDFDEAYYAEGAREMLARGDLLTPYYNGQPFLLKPILIYWLIAGSFSGFGVTEFAARVGSAFLGTVVVLLTYWFGARTLSPRAGFLAGLALALNYMWLDIARDASIDVPLTAALAPALFLFFLATRARPPQRRWLYLACYPLFGLALLAKGPAPTAVVLIGLLAYLLAAGRLRATLAEAQLLPGIALTLAVAAPWYVYEALRQPDFLRVFLLREHFGHIQGELARTEPWWGQLKNLFAYFLPWSAFLPAALVHAFRPACRPAGRQQDRGHALRAKVACRFAACWLIAVVLIFSFPQAKLPHYLAPAFPAAALLVGAWLEAWLGRSCRAGVSPWRMPAVAFGVAAVVGLACAVLAGVAALDPPWLREMIRDRFGDWTPGIAPVVMLSALGAGFLGAAAAASRERRAVVPLLAGGMLVAAFIHVGWFKPRLALIQAQPRKELAQLVSAALPESEPLGVYYARRNSTIFYARRPIVDLGEREEEFAGLLRFLSSPAPAPRLGSGWGEAERSRSPATALTHSKFLPRLEQALPGISVWTRRGDYVLVSNHESDRIWRQPRRGVQRRGGQSRATMRRATSASLRLE